MSLAMNGSTPPGANAQRLAWEEFRRNCFLWVVEGAYCWSAGCQAEAHAILVHLLGAEGFSFELTQRALVVRAYGVQHLIPISQLTPASLLDLRAAQLEVELHSIAALRTAETGANTVDSDSEQSSDATTLH